MPPTIRIGFVDDGISNTAYYADMNHDEDGSAKLAWKSFVTGSATPCQLDPGCSDHGHGTAVASLAVASAAFSGTGVGIAGNSRKGVPVSLKFSDGRVASPNNMISALDYGTSPLEGRGNCKVISNSNGFFRSQLTNDAYLQMARVHRGAWVNRGAFVVASSGNEYKNIDSEPNFARYPAGFGEVVFAVGATSFAGRIWSSRDLFGLGASTAGSTHGSHISLVAPGAGISHMLGDGTIRSIVSDCAWNESSFGNFSGTSLAAPLVAGAAAWLLALQPSLTNDDIRRVLELSAKDLGATGKDPVHGYGQLDMLKAAELISSPNWLEHGAIGAGNSIPLGSASPVATTLLLSGTAVPAWDTGTPHSALRYELIGEALFESDFAGAPELWIRRALTKGIDGTGIWDDATRLPWAAPHPNGYPGNFYRLLHTYVYELTAFPETSPLRWFPCPPSQAVISYTALGPTTLNVPVGTTGTSLAIRPISNPARGRLRLALSGIASGPLRVELFDVAGRSLARLFEGASRGNTMNLEWDGISSSGRAAPGLYIVRVEQPGRRIACRVSYMR